MSEIETQIMKTPLDIGNKSVSPEYGAGLGRSSDHDRPAGVLVGVIGKLGSALRTGIACTATIPPGAIEYRGLILAKAVLTKVMLSAGGISIRLGSIRNKSRSNFSSRVLFCYDFPLFLLHNLCFQFIFDLNQMRIFFLEKENLILKSNNNVSDLNEPCLDGLFGGYIKGVFDKRR